MTKCDSGITFNPLMHVFIFITLVFGLGMIIGDPSVMASVLYMRTADIAGAAVNLWGLIAVISVVLHIVGLFIRGKYGIQLMSGAMLCGFYIWLWAAIIYLSGAFYFQFLVGAVPNLLFWIWYAWNWRKRYRAPGDPSVEAFTH